MASILKLILCVGFSQFANLKVRHTMLKG